MRPLKSMLAAAMVVCLTSGIARAEPVKVRIGWVAPVVDWASILFEKPEVLKHLGKSYAVEPVHFQGTPLMIVALANGELEVASFAFSTFSLAIQNAGMDDLRVIADNFQDGVDNYHTHDYVVLKDSSIKTVRDLRGKILATNAMGSALDIVMRVTLRKNGLDDRKDVTFIETAIPNMKAMLLARKVDLIPGVLPFAFDPEFQARTRPLFKQKAMMGRTQMVLWAARASFLQKNRAAMVDFLEDVLRASRFLRDPKNRREVVQIAARVSKQPPERFNDWLFTEKDYFRDPNLLPDLDALQANIKMQADLGLLKRNIDVGKHADLSLVKEAAKRLK